MPRFVSGRFKGATGFVLGFVLLAGPALVIQHAYAKRPPAPFEGDYSPPPQGASEPMFRIVAFGSSSTYGYGASSPALAYPHQLAGLFAAQGTRVEVVNRGINGEDVDAMMRRLDDDVLPRRPDLVLWQVGSNDIIDGMALEHFLVQVRNGIARMRAAGSTVVLIGPQWSPTIVKADPDSRFANALRALGQQEGVAVIDRTALMKGWVAAGLATQAQLVGPDSLHASDLGYTMLARAVWERIDPTVTAGVQERLARRSAARE